MPSNLAIASNGVNGLNELNMPEMDFMQDMSAYDDLSIFDGTFPDCEMNAFGVLGLMMNPRHINAVTGQAGADFHKYDTADILQQDIQTLKPMAEALEQYRVMGKRIFERDRVSNLLDIENDRAGNHKVAALYKLYCAMYGGLKDENAPITFDNLKDPGLLIKQSKRLFAPTAAQSRSKEIEQLTQVAVEGHNPELAAVLLNEMSKRIGVDDKTVKAILVESREHMDDATHKRFLTEVNEAHQHLTGKTLDKYIHKNYSKGGIFKFLHIFGANEKGKEYLEVLDTANKIVHHVSNPGDILGAIGSPWGLAF